MRVRVRPILKYLDFILLTRYNRANHLNTISTVGGAVMKSLKTAVIKFPTHTIRVNIDERNHIHCFKYNGRSCDFAVFESQLEAGDYMVEPLPTIYYEVTVQDD